MSQKDRITESRYLLPENSIFFNRFRRIIRDKTNVFVAFAVFLLISYISGLQPSFAAEHPQKGGGFPDILLSAPKDMQARSYLGLKETPSFTISDIKAEVVILEVFSMYCPYCQKEAPLVNELFDRINESQSIKDRIKIVGIGAGNTEFEVQVFRTKYSIPFPLIVDDSFSFHKAIGEVRTPYFFVIKIKPDGSNTILYSQVGTIKDPKTFLELILSESGLK